MTAIKLRASGGRQRRFVGAKVEPEKAVGLDVDHPAVREGRSLFPSKVVSPADSPRLFVSGRNNSKLGGMVTKGPRRGWPIYQLSLEERATCPRSCHVYELCYGNSSHLSRRHRNDEHLIPMMKAELRLLASIHPDGFLVRLHTLGDFYSVDYVVAWAMMLRELPALHVFGYTARSEDADDDESKAIAKAVRKLSTSMWERFAIRFSRDVASPQGSMVAYADPEQDGQVVCPAQTGSTDCCATCGLCWAPAFQQSTIVFLAHGIKRNRGPYSKGTPEHQVAKSEKFKMVATRETRLASIDEQEKARIMAAYGVQFKG
jgi:hypothetical protein